MLSGRLVKSELMSTLPEDWLSENRQIIEARLDEEIAVIRKIGLEHYIMGFRNLLLQAFGNDVPLYVDSLDGEGSLVLYCLGFTFRNPIEDRIGFSSFLNKERPTVPWFNIICRTEDFDFVFGQLADYFGEEKVGLIPNGIGLLLGKTGTGEPFCVEIEESTGKRVFRVQPAELERYGIVPVGLDEVPMFDDLVVLEHLIRQKEPDFRTDLIPVNDAETFEMLSGGETFDLFFLCDNWMSKYLSILKPRCIEELDAIMSLYHNGPVSLIPLYLEGKTGMLPEEYRGLREIDVLKKTYGVVVHREQIIDVLQDFAGFSAFDASCFWRALAGKYRKVMEQYWKRYFANASRLGLDEILAVKLAKMIDEFSRDTGYERKVGIQHTLIAYRMAWIKRHYGKDFKLLLQNV